MGHYDDCRDAHEAVELREMRERRAKNFRELIQNRTDEELGTLLVAHDDLRQIARVMSGTRDQHRTVIALETAHDAFYKRR